MAYILLLSILLVTVIVEPIVLGIPVANNDIHESCDAQITPHCEPYQCSSTVSVSRDCQAAMLNLSGTNMSESCNSIDMFWSYPMGNLTIIIETPFTTKHQAYVIHIENEHLIGVISHVYRLINGGETEVTTKRSKLIQNSDSNYQIILKLQGPSELFTYGVFIDYDIVKS